MTSAGQIRWHGRVGNTGDGKIDTAHLSLAGANALGVEGCSPADWSATARIGRGPSSGAAGQRMRRSLGRSSPRSEPARTMRRKPGKPDVGGRRTAWPENSTATRKEAVRLPERPKSREETPKEGGGSATRIAVPHRNKMLPRCTKVNPSRLCPCCGAQPRRHGVPSEARPDSGVLQGRGPCRQVRSSRTGTAAILPRAAAAWRRARDASTLGPWSCRQDADASTGRMMGPASLAGSVMKASKAAQNCSR